MSSGREWTNVPVLLQTQIPSGLQYVDMERFVPQEGDARPVRKKKKRPSIGDESITELSLYVYVEFKDATREEMFNLNTAPLK